MCELISFYLGVTGTHTHTHTRIPVNQEGPFSDLGGRRGVTAHLFETLTPAAAGGCCLFLAGDRHVHLWAANGVDVGDSWVLNMDLCNWPRGAVVVGGWRGSVEIYHLSRGNRSQFLRILIIFQVYRLPLPSKEQKPNNRNENVYLTSPQTPLSDTLSIHFKCHSVCVSFEV